MNFKLIINYSANINLHYVWITILHRKEREGRGKERWERKEREMKRKYLLFV